MTPEKQPALIDVIAILTRKDKRHSAEVWRRLESHSRAMDANCVHAIFPDHHRDTPIAKDLKTLLQVIFMLPGKEASLVRHASFEQRKRELEFQEDLKDRAIKRRREVLQLEAEEIKLEGEKIKLEGEKIKWEAEKSRIKQEELLQKLVSDSHPEAVKVFIDRLSTNAARPRCGSSE